jgi:hypothetical protein
MTDLRDIISLKTLFKWMNEETLSQKEVIKKIHKTKKTVIKMGKEGKLHPMKLKARILYDKNEI